MDDTVVIGTFTDYGNRYQYRARLRISPAQLRTTGQTVTHEPIPADAVEVAITGETWHANADGSRDRRHRDIVSGGQNVDDLRKVGTARAQRIADLWDRWHLNGMRANCAHMAESHYVKGLACPETGYLSGSAWLFEPVPADVLAELRTLFGKPAGWVSPIE